MKEKKPAAGLDLGVMNVTPAKFYTKNPCTIGFSLMRLQVSGAARACCIAKHAIGDLNEHSWREIWRSAAYAAFRSKMLRIHQEHFHLKDPEFLFCQQCSHMTLNADYAKARSGSTP